MDLGFGQTIFTNLITVAQASALGCCSCSFSAWGGFYFMSGGGSPAIEQSKTRRSTPCIGLALILSARVHRRRELHGGR
jgi:hypothetical protein